MPIDPTPHAGEVLGTPTTPEFPTPAAVERDEAPQAPLGHVAHQSPRPTEAEIMATDIENAALGAVR